MDQDPNSYKYQPLATHDSIRILHLQPGSGNDIIHCTLEEVFLGKAEGKYEAVSYVWGSSDITATIICDGAALPVTTNLELGFRAFRLKNISRSLWADAVCINQKDEREKSQQVRKMGRIFREAKHVMCWLGRDDSSVANDCFRFIRNARIAMEQEFQPEWTMGNLIRDTKLLGVSKTAREWDLVAQLFGISWFQRVWIVQEVALAKACYLCWGTYQVHFYEALSVASWLAYSIHAPSPNKGARVGKLISDVFIDIMHTFDNRPTWRDMILFNKILEDLHPARKQLYVDLLFCARSLQVTDQRVVIYSSLGSPLAHSFNGEVMVTPDYTEPWEQQQIRAAKALLRNSREGPYVLSMIIHDSEAELLDDQIPSWVPRWNTFDKTSNRPVPLTSTYEYRQKPFRASLGSPLFNPTFPSPDILSVTGWKYDTVAWVSSRLKFVDLQGDLEDWKPHLGEKNTIPIELAWLQLLDKTSMPPEELIGPFSVTLARGRPASDDHVDDLLLYCERLRSKAGTETISPFPPSSPTLGDLSNAERSIPRSRDRRLAMTALGRMALVPLIAEANDICCIVQRMDVPIVLRNATNGTYQCIGETYCSGVMEGELLGPECTDESRWSELRIR